MRLYVPPTLFSRRSLTSRAYSAFASTILRTVYGIDATTQENELFTVQREGQHMIDLAYTPGRYVVEVLPVLQYLPKWFPGVHFKRDAAAWRPTVRAMRDAPYEAALEAIVSDQVITFKSCRD